MTADEYFQNSVVRPIIKSLHKKIILVYKDHLIKSKVNFMRLSEEHRSNYVTASLQKDAVLKNVFIGMVVGHFTEDELELYFSIKNELNRRITDIIRVRISSNQAELVD